ncbi:hypothetical protein TNCV_3980601 [Trichonephila clavipes]|nr:hypothetical protein TNCV_3980601 [Trichonephila clavipes]
METKSTAQSKSYLTAKTFLDFLLQVTPHRSLNTSRGVVSEPDLLSTSKSEILEGFSGQNLCRLALRYPHSQKSRIQIRRSKMPSCRKMLAGDFAVTAMAVEHQFLSIG